MVRRKRIAGLLLGAALSQSAAKAHELPHVQRNGDAIQLIVDGAPYLALAGELHNSSPSSPAYMAPIWDRLARNHVRTVIGAASWELVEPEEGRFDFTAVDDEIRQARAHKMRLIMIWFGAYKNAESTYAPSWVRRDERRFARAQRDPDAKPRGMAAYFGPNPTLNVFSEAVLQSDALAFAALMRHIKTVDRQQTVIMMQVENEVGLRGDSRDRSSLADQAWAQQVPVTLMRYLREHRSVLRPSLVGTWERHGFRESGTWAEVFGTDRDAEEIFMAWSFGRYVDRVAQAGAAEYPLPMYANAWLGPVPGSPLPGDYPSGGPVARMMDIWKAAAPSLTLLAPDIYIDDFDGTLSEFQRPDNPIFIPEARFDAGNLFLALGRHDAIAFSPFGIEDGVDDDAIFQAYRLLNEMTGPITTAQAAGHIRGIRITEGTHQQEELGGYDFSFSGAVGTMGAFGAGTGSAAQANTIGYGLLINTGAYQFLIVGRGITVRFSAPGTRAEIDSAQEGVFSEGRWVPGRTLNGDERYFLFPDDSLRIVRITLLRRQSP